MRKDAIGFFWQDVPIVKPPKAEKPKRTPPPRTWEDPSYLPGLEEARQFNIGVMTDDELFDAMRNRDGLIFDCEVYPNYFLAAFLSLQTGKITYVESRNSEQLNKGRLNWILENFITIGFNSLNFDLTIGALAVTGRSNAELQTATSMLISEQMRPADVLKQFKTKKLKLDHIDLIEVAPLRASLKIYGGRIHCPRMQDLPFKPGTVLTDDQIDIVRWYCVNDLTNTLLLYKELYKEIELRYKLGAQYDIDLRSKSDAQVAEAIIAHEVSALNGVRAVRPHVEIGTAYRYNAPQYLKFQSPLMQWVLENIKNTWFVVGLDGSIELPENLKTLKIDINGKFYQLGIGGLHSCEKGTSYFASDEMEIVDRDVASYYPRVILNQGLYPAHLGPAFLTVYAAIVNARLAAKRIGDKVVADSLKITINGSFGKFGSMWSILYAPDFLIQVTMTGQLTLLLLIERMEMAGISVLSANTDGIVMACPKGMRPTMDAIVKQWEYDTQFETEETLYKSIHMRDVNNYLAVKIDGSTKTKGVFAESGLTKNPTSWISTEAVINYLTKKIPIAETVYKCEDITKFLSVRTVDGGAVKLDPVWGNNQYLGKAIRWYYAAGETGEIVYAKSGNKVARSDGAIPLMELPKEMPTNIDYDWYIKESEKMLDKTGYNAVTI